MFKAVAALVVVSLVVPLAGWSAPQSTRAKPGAQKSTTKKSPAKKKAPTRSQTRARSAAQAFKVSAELKPMAAQLLQARSLAGYNAVQAYARKHQADAAGALAWLVVGYARWLDGEYPQAIEALLKAKPRAGELRDYVDYLLVASYGASNEREAMLTLAAEFPQRYPDSVWRRDVAQMRASALLSAGDAPAAVIALEPFRGSGLASVTLLLGQAHAAAGNMGRARELLEELYVKQPTSPEASEALAGLQAISGRGAPPLSLEKRKARAARLVELRRYSQAAGEYRALQQESETADVWVGLGGALTRSGDRKAAKELLERIPEEASELNAERLYYLADIARDDEDLDKHREYLDKLRASAPKSRWFEEALLSAANLYLLRNEFQESARYFTEIYKFFPQGRYAAYAHWKAAWLTYRLRLWDEAKRLFEEQVTMYPASSQVGAALYWRGRLAERERRLPVARAYYQKLIDRFQSFYYADRARERVRVIKLTEIAEVPLLAKIPAAKLEKVNSEPPADNLTLQKARLLANAGMFDFAVREIERSLRADEAWAGAEIAALYRDKGQHHRALHVMKRAVPGYYAVGLSALPRNFWETLFPRLYWNEVQRYSAAHNLDPHLVASLIRQESEFNPGARSVADARGLMQVVPRTGRTLAKREKIRRFNAGQLYEPSINLRLGTRYLREMIDRYDGHVEYALAAYNAGPHRVKDWLEKSEYADMAEFVESIPFTETREYVQAIMRNSTIYKQLYAR